MRDRDDDPAFETLFGGPPEAAGDAPGRVNLIGEHTDYHDGYVLPTIIPQRTRVDLRRRVDDRVRVWSAAFGRRIEEYRLGDEQAGRGWLDYVQGVTAMLAREGAPLAGFEMRIASSVPVGAGVSSSAALEVGMLRALRRLLRLGLDDFVLAQVGQRAETDFVGAPVGIMDQMAASLGRDGAALFIDTRTRDVTHIPLPPALDVVVIDSGVSHRHAGGDYAVRRRESFEAAALLGVGHLRDVPPSRLDDVSRLPPLLARRARHVVSENARVLAAVEAFRAQDAHRLGSILHAGHVSLRDDYETSTADVDRLVDAAERHPDVYGARLTGGGFGGAVVVLARRGTAHRAAAEIADAYAAGSKYSPLVLVPAS